MTEERIEVWEMIKQQMPKLILHMALDFDSTGYTYMRCFAILKNRELGVAGTIPLDEPRYVHYEDEHTDLLNDVAILVNHGFVIPLDSDPLHHFRMTNELVDLLLKEWPNSRLATNHLRL